jgi:aquaporin related protein
MLAAEKHRSTPFAPVCIIYPHAHIYQLTSLFQIGIGLTLFACHLWGVIFTGAAMNTARAFGPAVVTGFNEDHWVVCNLSTTCLQALTLVTD